jgi:hypothetical protein
MNTSLTVKKSTDSNFIPVKYRIIEVTVGANAAGTYCLLETVAVGWDTEAHFNNWKGVKTYDAASGTTTIIGRDATGIQGTIGDLEVIALTTLVAFTAATPSTDR